MRVKHITREERINLIAPERELLSPSAVLEIIEPVDPDSIHHLGSGVYEVRWSDAETAAGQIVALCSMMPRVMIFTSPEELGRRPEGLPTWTAVQIGVTPLPLQTSEAIS